MSFTCGHTLHKMLTELAAYLDGFVSREAYDAVVKERDDLRLYAAQCSLNADNANISLGCACEELKEMREAFGLVSTLAPHRIADPSHPIDWARGIERDVQSQQDRIVEEVRKAEAERDTYKRKFIQRDKNALAYAEEVHRLVDENSAIRAERDALAAKAAFPRCRECGKWKQP